MTSVQVVSVNVKSNPLVAQSKVAARIKQAMALGDVVMGQEITPARYKSAWTAAAKASRKATYGTGSETPISVGGGLRATKAYTTKVHGGLAKVSPTRAYTVVQALTPDGLKVAFVCLHPVSKGYEGARHRATKWSWRNARLKQYQAAVAKETATLHAAGFTVVVGGDCNDPKPPRPHRDAAVLAGSGLDHMWVLAADGHSAGSRSQHITPASASLRMDHPIIVGQFDLQPAGKHSAPTPSPPPSSTPAPQPTSPTQEAPVRVTLGHDSSGRPLVVDSTWLAKLRAAEKILGFTFTIVQGSWRGSSGAAASAGTHDRGGVGDLRTWNIPSRLGGMTRVLTVLRQCGLIAWYRTPAQGFDYHIHAIDYGNPNLAPSAARQVTAWIAGRNGLANNGPDDGPRVTVPKNPPKELLSMSDIDDILKALHSLDDKVTHLAGEVQKIKSGTGRLEKDAAAEGERTGSSYWDAK